MSTVRPAPEAPDAPGGRRRPARDDVRRAVLDAAATVFARQGIDGASLDDVAAAAGFTKGAVYSNFASKDGLVRALVEERTSAYLALGLDAVRADASLAQKARTLGDRLTAAGDEQRDWHLLLVELWQRAVRSQEHHDSFVARRTELREGIVGAISEQAEHSDAALPMPAGELATVLMALVNGLAFERLLAPDEVPPDLMGRVLGLLFEAPPFEAPDPATD